MNLKNSNFNYNRKYKSLVKYLIIALPILLLLIACIFPTKKVVNTYALEDTTTTETETTINFNQLAIPYNNTEFGISVNYLNNGTYTISGTATSDNGPYLTRLSMDLPSPLGFYGKINHKYYIRSNLNFTDGLRVQGYDPISRTYASIQVNRISSFNFINDNYYVNVWFRGETNNTYYFDNVYLECFDLTEMGLDNITKEDFDNLFPLNYIYTFNKEISLSSLTITNNIGNEALNPLETQEIKEPNQAILKPLNLLYKAEINNWYDSFLNAFSLNYEDNDYMYYLVHFPLYVLYVCLLDLLLDIILLVPALIHRLVHRYKGDD